MNLKRLGGLFSVRILSVTALIFAVAISVATFIEYHLGKDVAWFFIYDALWFELLLSYIAIGSVINTFTSKMYTKGKVGIVLFHLSIGVIILGAGITRFFGDTGTLRIREGAKSSELLLDRTQLRVSVFDAGKELLDVSEEVSPNRYNQDYFKGRFNINGKTLLVEPLAYSKSDMRLPVSKFRVDYNDLKREAFVFHSNDVEPAEVQFDEITVRISIGNRVETLPFSLHLDSFVMERYPGSISPSSYSSFVRVEDSILNTAFNYHIYMNHILKYKGYRFFQASYDNDEKGTILSVNNDPWGTTLTYIGYTMLILGMFKALFDSKSRFLKYLGKVKNAPVAIWAGMVFMLLPIHLQAQETIPDAQEFGKLWVQTSDGRIKPMNTFSGDLLRKLSRTSERKNSKADAVILEIIRKGAEASKKPLLYKNETGIPELDRLKQKRIPYDMLFDKDGSYILEPYVSSISKKQPGDRSKTDNNILALDERANIFNMLRNGYIVNFFPKPGKPADEWLNLRSAAELFLQSDSVMQSAFTGFYTDFFSSRPEEFASALAFIAGWQSEFGGDVLPSAFHKKVELTYNGLSVFERLSRFYGLISLVYLISAVVFIASRKKLAAWLSKVMGIHLIVASLIHGAALLMRGIISGHIPLGNGYEVMIFVAWLCILIGIWFYEKSDLTFALLGLLATSALMVANLSFMNPQITPLVPVLKSVWLNIHVTVITASYAFFGGSFIIALATLVFMAAINPKNSANTAQVVRQLIIINRMVLIPGLYLLTIGCFLGGVWANQSWGKYWGWDPKETWCLVSILVYSLVAHLHHIPGLKGSFFFVAGSLLAFSSILMTYFGVNYFLGGMHSYAGEGSVTGLPDWAYVALVFITGLLIIAYNKYIKVLSPKLC